MSGTYHIITYGCLMNEYDSQRAAALLEHAGFTKPADENSADLVILNTCSVREKPQNKVNSAVGMLVKNRRFKGKPGKIGVMGCVAQQLGERYLKKNQNVDFIIGTDSLDKLPDAVSKAFSGVRTCYTGWSDDEFEIADFGREESSSGLVTIMKGCNNFCSYCIVPYVRGPEKSRKPEEILNEVRRLAEDGVKEVTLLGQNVNSYGVKSEFNMSFPKLLEQVSEVEGITRVRFMTSHPKDFSREMAEVIAAKTNICSYIHLPLQAGSDNVLRNMDRKYTLKDYMEKIAIAKEVIPDATFSSDFIVGFPGESDADFQKTIDAVKAVEYENIYAFNYSVRPGTAAEKLADDVPADLKLARLTELNVVQGEIMARKLAASVGEKLNVMISKKEGDVYSGRTLYNRIVNFISDRNLLVGEEVDVLITEAKKNSLFGKY